MDIFKGQSPKNESGTDTQRMFMEAEQAQRVVAGESEQKIGVPLERMITENENLRTTKELEVYYPSNEETTNNRATASIRKETITPASNTQALR